METKSILLSGQRSQPSGHKGWVSILRRLLEAREMTLLLIVLGCVVLFGFTVPNFASLTNVLSIADTLVFDVMITTGMTMALVSGGFDLSVGSVFASTGVVVAVAMVAGLPVWLSVLVALLSAAAWGLLNYYQDRCQSSANYARDDGHGPRLCLYYHGGPRSHRVPRHLH